VQALRVDVHGSITALATRDIPTPTPGPGDVLVQVQAASINPSDIVSAEGRFSNTRLPRTLGRDFAGRVTEGPPDLVGRDVYGSGGDLGVRRDGAHAEYIVVARDAVAIRPSNLTVEQAAAIGVPFVTAWTATIGVGQLTPGQWVVASGAAGAVGGAAAQLAVAHGGHVVGLVKDDAEASRLDHATFAAVARSDRNDLVDVVKKATAGRGADLALNGVGAAIFQLMLDALAPAGALVIYSAAGGRQVTLDLLTFYHGRLRLLGVDTIAADAVQCARILTELTPLFESGALRPLSILERYPLSDAARAYARVAAGAPGKIVLIPDRLFTS
jgi:NADPH:quinone reductase-like Zn-dependent oxidoreductase